jgi:cardiolipin synthase
MPDGLPRLPDRGLNNPGLHGIITLANLVTFARLCAVPIAVWLALRDRMQAVFWLVLCASLSDALDGWLARRRGPTRLGAVLDPMADKALLISMVITLAALDVLPDFVAILVVFRDLLIVGGVLALLLSGHPVTIRPLRISKLNTGLQLALVAAALLSSAYGVVPPLALAALIWATVATTLASGAAYVWKVARA